MMIEKLISTLDRLLALHLQLYKVSLQKTEHLKKNDIEALKESLMNEQKFVQAIKQIELERTELTSQYLNRSDDLTLTACMEKATGPDQDKLLTIYNNFKDVMDKLKGANQLNQQLTQQSLQFVSLSIDMLMPQESVQNYDRPDGKTTANKRRSIFDSKA